MKQISKRGRPKTNDRYQMVSVWLSFIDNYRLETLLVSTGKGKADFLRWLIREKYNELNKNEDQEAEGEYSESNNNHGEVDTSFPC
jgi:hypothetical protein